MTYAENPRRSQPLAIAWIRDDLVGRISIDGEYWGAVEWSEKRQCWCIEDNEGKCLRHTPHIRGAAPDKESAVSLAAEMIRDGRMPSPQEAKAEREKRRREERVKRAKQPSAIRRREAAAQAAADFSARMETEHREEREQPLYV